MSGKNRSNICKKALRRNLDRLAQAYKSRDFVLPYYLASPIYQLSNNVNELNIDYNNICYFGMYPDLFYSQLSDKVM